MEESDQSLGQSYRQSVRELICVAVIWIVFAILTAVFGAATAFELPSDGEKVPTILGMPRWVCFTVLFPWIACNVAILWFALRFMKDTPLEASEGQLSNEIRDDT